MKKIISLVLVGLIGLTIIPKTLVNERHTVLESTTSVYTKEEVDSLLSAIRTNITNNTNELTNIKSELTTLQNSLKDYALKTSLNTTNSNIDGLNTVVTNNTARIEALENSSSNEISEFTLKSNQTAKASWDSTQSATVTATYTPEKDCIFMCHGYISEHSSNHIAATSANMPGIRILELKGTATNAAIFDYVNMGKAKAGEEITCEFYAFTKENYINLNIDILTDEK